MRLSALAPLFTACIALSTSAAQGDTAAVHAQQDSAIERARQLVNDGKVVEGRKTLDSLLKTITTDSSRYAEALYWRAALAPTAADAERDYRRLLIEAPLSTRAEDAMIQLAQLEEARGDKRGAIDHLNRFMLSYANNAARPRVSVWLVRLLFDQPGQLPRSCAALRTARDVVPVENVELRNRLDYYAPRCAGEVAVAVAPAGAGVPTDSTQAAAAKPAVSPPVAAPAAAPATTTPAPTPTAPSATSDAGFYSVQVAAYDSHEPAKRMAQMLIGQGLAARVDGSARPYRVRVGKYSTRAEAVKSAASLKAQGIGGFVTLVKAPAGGGT